MSAPRIICRRFTLVTARLGRYALTSSEEEGSACSSITGSSRKTEESPSAKAGRSHLPLPISTQARRKNPKHQTKRPFLGCCLSTSSSNGSPGRRPPRGLSICHQVCSLRQAIRHYLGDGLDSTSP